MYLNPAIQLVLAAITGLIAPAVAQAGQYNNWVTTADFNNHALIARKAAPEWHFDYYELCYPSAAYWEGKKTPPGKYWNVDGREGVDGCSPERGFGTGQAWAFPTYYKVAKCQYDSHVEYHVLYDVFFAYSTNTLGMHEYDWEWAVVKWEAVPNNPGKWRRKSIVLAAHGKTKEWNWADFPATNAEGTESIWRKNSNNPIIKFGLDGHGLEAKYGSLGKWYRSRDWLVDGDSIPETNWGSANSPPHAFKPGGWRDLCWYV